MAAETAASLAELYASRFGRPAEDVAADLLAYAALLEKWQRVQNLVSRETLADLWSRHMGDSLQVLDHVSTVDREFLDIGSGGGFPALPMAIVLKSRGRFRLVEANARKASFLRTVARELELPVTIENGRAEQIDSRETQLVTARALAPLPQLLGLLRPHFGPGTRAILHKGREHVEELAESRALWRFEVLIHQSRTDASGVLLDISNLRAISEA